MEDFLINSRTYRIEKELGSGGGGTVFLAYHTRLQKYVVIKKMKNVGKTALERRAETDILKNLHHPNLPQVFDFVEETTEDGEEQVYTVMDFIPGDTLNAALISGRKFTQEEVIHYLSQLLDAVNYLHKQKPPIIHGDIKPSNIMLTPDNDIVLIDFNISSFSDTQEFLACTKEYAAPEQRKAVQENWARRRMQKSLQEEQPARHAPAGKTVNRQTFDDDMTDVAGADDLYDMTETEEGDDDSLLTAALPSISRIDERSDIYSIGASMYPLLTRRKPGTDYVRRKPLIKEDLPIFEGLAYIIDKAMSFDPKDRFQSVEEMIEALQGIGKKNKRYKRLFAAQIAFCLLVVALGAGSALTAFRGYQMMQREKADQYYQTALKLYQEQAYEEDLNYILIEALKDEKIYDSGTRGNLYYLAANCFFEMNEYDAAAEYYEKAVQCDRDNTEYYCNYAIALTKQGKTEEAKSVISMAETLGIRNVDLDLMYAELAAGTGDTEEAARYFEACIGELGTDVENDAYLTARVYLMYSSLYEDAEGYETSERLLTGDIDVLQRGREAVSEEYRPLIDERLLHAYRMRGLLTGSESDLELAYAAGESVLDSGVVSFDMYQNLATICEDLGDLERAENVLLKAQERFGENYILYKRLALLELLKQDQKETGEREYQTFAGYYDQAVQLFKNTGRQEDADMEMQQLEEYYRSLVETGWLEKEAAN